MIVAIAAVLIVALTAAIDDAEAQVLEAPAPTSESGAGTAEVPRPGATEPETSTAEPEVAPAGTEEGATRPESGASATETTAERAVRLTLSKSSPGNVIFDTGKKARFIFALSGSARHDVTVRAIKVGSDNVVRHWKLANVPGGEKQVVRWDGKRQRKGFVSEGKYTFKVFPTGRRGSDPIQESTRSRKRGKTRLKFHRHMFPLPARHTYGDGFGAGRNHKGQDIFAACGKKIRAARGGRVQYSGYHSSAGYYAVIDGRGTGWDYVYMHMEKRGRVKEGQRVRTGDLVGFNSDTGNASGCHLHFEMWSPTGWYEGGEPRPPTKQMKKWDRYS